MSSPTKRQCSLSNCAQSHDSRGYCKKHARLVRLGRDPETPPITMGDRILSHVEFRDGCWIWTGKISTKGYGQYGKRSLLAHRASYETFVGPIPSGLTIDHLCATKACVNPAHLEPVTLRENCRRRDIYYGIGSAKTHCPQGHEYTAENTYVNKTNQRHCRKCANARAKAQYWARKKEQ